MNKSGLSKFDTKVIGVIEQMEELDGKKIDKSTNKFKISKSTKEIYNTLVKGEKHLSDRRSFHHDLIEYKKNPTGNNFIFDGKDADVLEFCDLINGTNCIPVIEKCGTEGVIFLGKVTKQQKKGDQEAKIGPMIDITDILDPDKVLCKDSNISFIDLIKNSSLIIEVFVVKVKNSKIKTDNPMFEVKKTLLQPSNYGDGIVFFK